MRGPSVMIESGDHVVPIHLIRLRKVWLYEEMGSDTPRAGRVDLPLSLHEHPELSGRAILLRGFAAPPRSAEYESLAIQFEAVTGLRSVTLNEQPIDVPDPLPATFDIEVTNPLPRNNLRLEVDFAHARSSDPQGREVWGNIALAVRSS